MINSISAGLIKNYLAFQSKTQLTSEEMFKRLSVEMGGDGTSITKDQLNNYIEKAESGSFAVGKDKLNALKSIKNNWDQIAGKKDAIKAEDLADYSVLLLQSMGGSAETIHEKFTLPKADFFKYLMELMGTDGKGVSKNDLTTYLKSLIATDSEHTDHSNEIAMTTDLIAEFDTVTKGSDYMTPAMLSASNGLVA